MWPYQEMDLPPAPAPSFDRSQFIIDITEALAKTHLGFHSSQLEAIMPIVEEYFKESTIEL